jgi:hypothetical protein
VKTLSQPLLILALLVACTTPKPESKTLENTSTTKTPATSITLPDTTIVKEDPDYGCVRGQAMPVLKKEFFPNSTFKVNADSVTGIETAVLTTGDFLTIYNEGCEYYVLVFRFETERFSADTTDTMYWFDKALRLMNEISPGLDAPLDMAGGTRAATEYLKKNQSYSLLEEIVYEDDIIRDFVLLNRIQRLSSKRFAIEISYGTGPL